MSELRLKTQTRSEIHREIDRFWSAAYKLKNLKEETEKFTDERFVSVDDLKTWVEENQWHAETSCSDAVKVVSVEDLLKALGLLEVRRRKP